MSETSIKQLADLIGAPVETLLVQLQDAGISASNADDRISDTDKLKLLEHIRQAQTPAASTVKKPSGKISLKRRTTSEINVSNSHGKSSVSVEVRRKKNFSHPAPATAPSEEDKENIEALSASANRSDDLAEQLAKERQAREAAVISKRKKADEKKASSKPSEEQQSEKTPVEEAVAKETVAKEGIDVEVVDLRTIYPWDVATVADSVRRTGKLLFVQEPQRTGGVGAEVVAEVAERCGYDLVAPPRRLTATDAPWPQFAIESHALVTDAMVVSELRSLALE